MHSSRFLSHKNKDLVEAVAIFFGLSSNRFAHSLIEEHIFRNAMHKAVLERVVEDLFVGFFQQ
jgi:thymidylate synthase